MSYTVDDIKRDWNVSQVFIDRIDELTDFKCFIPDTENRDGKDLCKEFVVTIGDDNPLYAHACCRYIGRYYSFTGTQIQFWIGYDFRKVPGKRFYISLFDKEANGKNRLLIEKIDENFEREFSKIDAGYWYNVYLDESLIYLERNCSSSCNAGCNLSDQSKNEVHKILKSLEKKIRKIKIKRRFFMKKISILILTIATMMLPSCGQPNLYGSKLVDIPGMDIKMLNTEVTQALYESVMGDNPSEHKGENLPVEMVSWYDAIYFCNKLSKKYGFKPVYAVDGKTNVKNWNYTLHEKDEIEGKITKNDSANGFRLPTIEEWIYAAQGGDKYKCSGSNNLDEVGWYNENSEWVSHPVAQKKANGYNIYDMSGNVSEWCWNLGETYNTDRYCFGGDYGDGKIECSFYSEGHEYSPALQDNQIGFRIVRNAK